MGANSSPGRRRVLLFADRRITINAHADSLQRRPVGRTRRPCFGCRRIRRNGDGRAAGVSSTSGVLYLGFPLETIDAATDRDALVGKLLDWQASVLTKNGR